MILPLVNIFILFILFSFPVKGQDKEYAKEVIDMLASPGLKGRGFTGNGHKIAAEYIRGQFAVIGLSAFARQSEAPVRPGKAYLQPFDIRVNTFPSRMKLTLNGILFKAGSEFLVHPSSPSVRGRFPMIMVRRNDLADTMNLNRIIKESAGHYIVIDERFDAGISEATEVIRDRAEAIKFGDEIHSAGTIVLTNEKLTWGISVNRATRPVLTVNTTRIPDDLQEIGVNIHSSFSRHKTNNIIGYVPGKEVPDSFLVFTAHYDHLGKMGKKVYFPGANDNASGVAMLLSLAKHFRSHPHRYSVVFMALSAEETGLNGARYFVENPLFNLSHIAFLINFDLAGTGDEGIKVVNGNTYPDEFAILRKINAERGYLKDVQIRGPACNSDHCIFYQEGIPCFYIYTLGGIRAYHDIYDRSETLPLTEFSDYAMLMIEFINALKL